MAIAQDAPSPTPTRRGSGFLMVRPALAGGLAFVEAARADAPDEAAVLRWFDDHLVGPGFMRRPGSVHEPGVGKVSFDAGQGARLSRIVATARVRVAALLGGLLASPADDRFLNAAIFAGRVVRGGGDRGPGWRPCPAEVNQLSDIVLSLFAADVLTFREEYDRSLCVCDVCGFVSLTPGAPTRRRCAQHDG